jgi:hypothetical protein
MELYQHKFAAVSADPKAHVPWSEQNNTTSERTLFAENAFYNFSQSPPFCAYIIHIKHCTVYRQPLCFLVTLFLIKSVPTNNMNKKVEKFSLISNFIRCNAYTTTTTTTTITTTNTTTTTTRFSINFHVVVLCK